MKTKIGDKEVKMIPVDTLIELLEIWKRNHIAISDNGYMCLMEEFKGEYEQFGVIHLDTEKTVIFDNM